MSFKSNRRKFLAAGVSGVAAGLAGCTGILADGRGTPGTVDRIEDDGEEGPPAGVPTAVHQYLVENDANLYEEEMIDHTGEDSVTIEVGAGGQGFSFSPPLINVDPGTEIVWEWTGEGGGHNVVSTEGPVDFRSGNPVSDAGNTYSRTFEVEGNHFYHCVPHSASGMHGAIVVGEPDLGDRVIQAYMEENDANLWEGEITDETGADSTTIQVGAGGQGFSFSPPAVRVDAGAEVTWEWTGEGGGHNVVSTEGPVDFRSGDPVSDAGTTYSRTFEVGGNHFYHCVPHSASGMHGVVVVEGGSEPEGGSGTDGNGTDGSGMDGNESESDNEM